jgi:short-subunit dehydrogenase
MKTQGHILVTGATSGLGREIAQQLAARGESVIASGRRDNRLAELSAYGDIQPLKLDLTSRDEITSACNTMPPLSGIILNAGITATGTFSSGNLETDEALIQTNVIANLHLIRGLLPKLNAHGGRIFIIASLGGLTPVPYQAVYSGTKAFMINYAMSLREELKHENIRVGVFAPGGIKTEMTDIPAMKSLEKQLAPAEVIATAAIRAYDKMSPLTVPGFQNKCVAALSKILPRGFMAAQAERIYRNARNQ